MVDEAPNRTETTGEFLERVQTIARTLPKGFVKSVIGRMRSNLQALVDARGYTPKHD